MASFFEMKPGFVVSDFGWDYRFRERLTIVVVINFNVTEKNV